MILSPQEIEALRLAARMRAVAGLLDELLSDLGEQVSRAELAAFVEDNKRAVAARTDLDMVEARYIIGSSYMRGTDARGFLAGAEFTALAGSATRKLKLERLYRTDLRKLRA